MKITREHFVGFSCIGLSIAVLCITPSFPKGQASVNITGPAFFPNVLAVAFIILGVAQIIAASRAARKSSPSQNSSRDSQRSRKIIMTVEFVALMLAFIAFFNTLGFVISTTCFLFLLMWLLGLKWWKSLLYAGIYTSVIYLLFGVLFTIGLPAGILGALGI